MSTTLAPPPVDLRESARSGAPARRAIRRWAWRLLRREWRQQALILALLALAVGATTVGLGIVVNIQSGDEGMLGTANARVDVVQPGPGGLARDVAATRAQFGAVEAIADARVPVPGSVTPVDLRAQDPHGAFSAPMLRLRSGAYPTGTDQAAVTPAVATTFGLKLGSTWTVNGRPLRVVGIVENPLDLQDAFGLVAPGAIAAPTSVTLLFDAGPSALMNFHPPAGTVVGIMSSGTDRAKEQRNQALAVLLLATIGLTFIGLLSVAGFTVMAQRRQRALGMIAAIGATDRQVRRMLLSNGAAVGTVGAAGGVVLGTAAWLALTPAFESMVGHRYDPFAIPWWAVAAGALLAVVAAVAASWWPARAASRLPVVAALSGRPPLPRPAHRFALAGVIAIAGGVWSLVAAHRDNNALIVVGIVAVTAGVLLGAPLGIRAVALVGRRAPIAVRLALRDLARYQARSGAALASASLAVGIAATITVLAAAQQAHDQTLTGGNLPTNQLIVWLDQPGFGKGGGTVAAAPVSGGGATQPALPSAAALARARATADAIAQAVHGRGALELDTAVDLSTPLPAGAPPDAAQAAIVRPMTHDGQPGFGFVAQPLVATAAVLQLYGIHPGDIAPGTDVLTARHDLSGARLGSGRDFQPVQVQVDSRLPNYTSAPNTLLTPRAMAAHHLTADPAGWLVQAAHPLTQAQILDAQHRAAAAGIAVETRTAQDQSLQRLRDYATAAGILVALGVLAMTIGLIRSETAGDLRTLTATGASGRTRRTLNAATAGALGLLAGILGTAAAYLALIAWRWGDASFFDRPPYLNLAVLVFSLPLAAMVGAWLFGRTPRTIARRPRE